MDPAPSDGQVLSGKYRLGAVLGRGGMGLVREAEHLLLGKRVAVKVLRRDHAHVEEARERFRREAQSLCRIQDPHVVRVLDLGETPDGRPFLVMELLEGVCVATLAKRKALGSVAVVTELVRQACVGLAGAHRLGIVHRDIKPANLMVTEDGRGAACVKLLDFGIASESEARGRARLTKTGIVMGTPVYMSPEQIRAPHDAAPRSDVFSMGVVLYELLTGRLPWRATSPVDLVVRQYTEIPPPVDALRPGVPPALARVVDRCLALEPNDRFAHAGELAAALAPFAERVDAEQLVLDEDDVHTVVFDASPEDEHAGPAPAARDISALLSDAPPVQPPPTLPPAPLAPAERREAAPRRGSGPALVVLVALVALLLPIATALVVRQVAPHALERLTAPAPE